MEGFSGIKMGPGVMGRSAAVCVALVAMGAVTSVPLAFVNVWASLAAMSIPALAVLYIMRKAFAHSDKHPDQALMEGAHLLAKHRLDQRAKNQSVIEGSALAVANTAPPRQIAAQDPPGE